MTAFPIKETMIPAAINGLINGYIAWHGFADQERIALTVDSIDDGSHTAFGGAVLMATALGLILSLINFAMERKHAQRPMPRGEAMGAALRIGLKNAFFLFGLLACSALIWQRLFGTLMVSPLLASVLTACIAAAVSGYLVLDVRARHLELQGRR